MSLDELTALLESQRKQINEDRKFLAAIQGVDLDEDEPVTDIVQNKGMVAKDQGFGIGEGLAFMQLGGE